MLERIIDGVYVWEHLIIEHKHTINGYYLETEDGPILFDPPSAAQSVIQQIEALGKPKHVVVTGRFRQRRAAYYQQWYGATLWAPHADQRHLNLEPDELYGSIDEVPGGFDVVGLEKQLSPGECALYNADRKCLLAGHLVGTPPGSIRMQDRYLYRPFSPAFEAQLPLISLDFETLLPGRGSPIPAGGRVALAQFLANYAINT